jgi:hypothetical protein
MPPASWPGGAQTASTGQTGGDCGPHTPGVSGVGVGGTLQQMIVPLPVAPTQTWFATSQQPHDGQSRSVVHPGAIVVVVDDDSVFVVVLPSSAVVVVVAPGSVVAEVAEPQQTTCPVVRQVFRQHAFRLRLQARLARRRQDPIRCGGHDARRGSLSMQGSMSSRHSVRQRRQGSFAVEATWGMPSEAARTSNVPRATRRAMMGR